MLFSSQKKEEASPTDSQPASLLYQNINYILHLFFNSSTIIYFYMFLSFRAVRKWKKISVSAVRNFIFKIRSSSPQVEQHTFYAIRCPQFYFSRCPQSAIADSPALVS